MTNQIEIPAAIQEFNNRVIDCWTANDITRRNELEAIGKAYFTEIEYSHPAHQYRKNEYRRFVGRTDDFFRSTNTSKVNEMAQRMLGKIKGKVGEIVACENMGIKFANDGGLIMNGTIIGKNGTCKVRSFAAGGHNIQQRHYRTMVR